MIQVNKGKEQVNKGKEQVNKGKEGETYWRPKGEQKKLVEPYIYCQRCYKWCNEFKHCPYMHNVVLTDEVDYGGICYLDY